MHRLRAVSLFSWYVEQNGRDTQMTTRVTDGARRERLFFLLRLPPSFLASRGFAAQRSRARALPLLNLKKKRYCSQSHSCNVEKRHLYLTDVRLVQPPPQALCFSHGRGERETRVTGDEPQGTMGRVSFPPSFARTFSSKERRLGTRQRLVGPSARKGHFLLFL